jgi:hypothetical protein
MAGNAGKVSWGIDPLPQPNLPWLQLSNLSSHPLLPVVISVLLAGFNKNMTLVLMGLWGCAAWLAADLWPAANVASIILVNQMKFTKERRSKREEVERKRSYLIYQRDSVYRGLRAAIFCAICASVALLMLIPTKYLIGKGLEQERDEAYEGLHTDPIRDELLAGTDNRASLTLSNEGNVDVHLLTVSCVINSLETRKGFYLDGGSGLFSFEVYRGDLVLSKAGDGQSLMCPRYDVPMFGKDDSIVCGDLVWVMRFFLADQPKNIQTKRFRYALPPVLRDWRKVALDVPPLKCPK